VRRACSNTYLMFELSRARFRTRLRSAAARSPPEAAIDPEAAINPDAAINNDTLLEQLFQQQFVCLYFASLKHTSPHDAFTASGVPNHSSVAPPQRPTKNPRSDRGRQAVH